MFHFLLSVNIMLTAWDLSIDRSQVIKYILLVYEHNASRIDKIEEFRDAFVQYITRYRNEFPEVPQTGFDISSKSNAKGFVATYKDRRCVWVLVSEFETQLLKHGLDASPNVLKELHNRKIIERFGDRYRKSYKSGKLEPTCFCFYLDSAPADIAPKSKKKSKKKSSQLKSLLEE